VNANDATLTALTTTQTGNWGRQHRAQTPGPTKLKEFRRKLR
jgi:hypothetical protein